MKKVIIFYVSLTAVLMLGAGCSNSASEPETKVQTVVKTETKTVEKIVKETTYTVTFDSNGGSDIKAQTIIKDGTAVEPKPPVKNGMDFAGWYLNDAAYDFDTAVTQDVTLKANWTEPSASSLYITYHSNGAKDPEDNIKFVCGADGSAYVKPYFYNKPAWKFTGWNTAADGSGTAYKPGTALTLTENLDLYGQFTYIETIFELSSEQKLSNEQVLADENTISGYSMPGKLVIYSYWKNDNSWNFILNTKDGKAKYLASRVYKIGSSGTEFDGTISFPNGIDAGYITFSGNTTPGSVSIKYVRDSK